MLEGWQISCNMVAFRRLSEAPAPTRIFHGGGQYLPHLTDGAMYQLTPEPIRSLSLVAGEGGIYYHL